MLARYLGSTHDQIDFTLENGWYKDPLFKVSAPNGTSRIQSN